jgi:hypothetical protein
MKCTTRPMKLPIPGSKSASTPRAVSIFGAHKGRGLGATAPNCCLNALLALHSVPAVPESLSRRKTSLFFFFFL